MPKVGDRVTVKIRGQATVSGTLSIGEGASISVPGTIVEDRGEYWVVELNMSIEGKNRMLVLKTAFNPSPAR